MQFRSRCRLSSFAAFTLIELLCVIAIVAVVAGFVFAAGTSANRRGLAARATAELASLGSALESYKLVYGDYPHTSNGAVLLQSLIGKRGPTYAATDGKAVLDLSLFTIIDAGDPFASTTAEVADPWGRSYFYAYKSTTPWTQASYVLFSSGPDGTHAALLSGGRVDESAAANQDNIYVQR
jgi:general secretion pathway protein G